MVELLHSAASDLGQHCLPITLLEVSRLKWVTEYMLCIYMFHYECLNEALLKNVLKFVFEDYLFL